jgi:hypothetical protein
MNGIAALAVKEVAVASGFGSGLLAPSAVDGFAVGTLLSGVCLLMAIGPRRRRRRARQERTAPSRVGVSAIAASVPVRGDYSAATMSGPLANEWANVVAPAEMSSRDESGHAQDSKNNGYRSKHRLSDSDASRRPESRRSAPRHAARAHRIGRMASKLPLHPVPVRD